MNERVSALGISIWLLGLLFFFYEFFLRIFLGTIAADLTHQLQLSAGQFSAIGSGYYLTYGLMQVPVGLLTERFGARLTLSGAAICCAIGVFLLSLANGFWLAFFSRLLIGFGSAFAFVSLLLLILKWFPKRHFSFMSGLSIFLGAIGPILAGGPLAWLYQVTDHNWRGILVGAGIFGLGLAALLIILVRNQPPGSESRILFLEQKKKMASLVGLLLKNAQVWLTLIYTSLSYFVLPLFAAYFGTLFLQARGVPLAKAASIISMQWVGYAIGSPLMGKLSDRVKRRKPFLYIPSLIGVIVSSIIVFVRMDELFLIPLFFLVGIAAAGQTLTFTIILENAPKKLHSSALGVNNSISMLCAALIATVVGWIIQKNGGTFSEPALTKGLMLVPVLMTAGFLVSLFGIKETYCHQQNEVHTLHKYSDIF